jgi:hypothetical protein
MIKLAPRCEDSWSMWRRRFVESVLINHSARIRSSWFDVTHHDPERELNGSKSETKGEMVSRRQHRNVALTGYSFRPINDLTHVEVKHG